MTLTFDSIEPLIKNYGLPGVALIVLAFLVYTLIDRGFTFQVPPKSRRR